MARNMIKYQTQLSVAFRSAGQRPIAVATATTCLLYGLATLLARCKLIDAALFMTISSLVLVWSCAHATVTDLTRRKISNWTTYGAAVAILAASLVARCAPDLAPRVVNVGWASTALGGALCAGIFLVPYLAGSGGAGDVKLAGCVGLALGLEDGLIALCASFFASFIYGLGRFIVCKIKNHSSAEPPEKVLVPMAPCFFFGALFVLSGLGSAFQYSDLPW